MNKRIVVVIAGVAVIALIGIAVALAFQHSANAREQAANAKVQGVVVLLNKDGSPLYPFTKIVLAPSGTLGMSQGLLKLVAASA